MFRTHKREPSPCPRFHRAMNTLTISATCLLLVASLPIFTRSGLPASYVASTLGPDTSVATPMLSALVVITGLRWVGHRLYGWSPAWPNTVYTVVLSICATMTAILLAFDTVFITFSAGLSVGSVLLGLGTIVLAASALFIAGPKQSFSKVPQTSEHPSNQLQSLGEIRESSRTRRLPFQRRKEIDR